MHGVPRGIGHTGESRYPDNQESFSGLLDAGFRRHDDSWDLIEERTRKKEGAP
jgi:hypothetical protein